jgi:hypothetical protein
MLQPPSLLCWLLCCDSFWAVPLQQQEQAAPLAAAQDTTSLHAAHVEWGPPQDAYITVPGPEVPVRANLLIQDVSDVKSVPPSVVSLVDVPASIPILDYASAPVPSPTNVPASFPSLAAGPSPRNVPASVPSLQDVSVPAPSPSNVPAFISTLQDVPASNSRNVPASMPSLQDVSAPSPSPRNVPASVPSLEDAPAPAPSPRSVPVSLPSLQGVSAPAPSPRNAPASVPSLEDVPSPNSRSVPAFVPSPRNVPASAPRPRNVPASVPSLEDAPATVTSHKDTPSDTDIDLVVASRPVGDESQTLIVRPVTLQETNLTVQQTTNASTPAVKWGQDRMLGLLAAQLSTVPVPVPGKVTPTLFLGSKDEIWPALCAWRKKKLSYLNW